MYCSNCGTKLTDDAVFCCHCGKRVHETSSPDVPSETQQGNSKVALRQNEAATLNSLIQYFAIKQTTYDYYDEACAKINRLARGASNALVIWGGIVLGFSLLVILSVVTSEQSFREMSSGLFLSIFLLLVPGIMMLAGGIVKKSRHRHLLHRWQQQYVALSQELHQHYRAYPNCPVIPECTNPRILVKLQTLIISGRANTIKEGMNTLFASCNHRGMAQYQEITQRNTYDCNYRNGLKFLFLPSKYFK